MERRIRLVWSPKHLRPWCPGASLPLPARSAGFQATGLLRVQGLMDRIRQHRSDLRAAQAARTEPAAPLPKPPTTQADAPVDAVPRDAAR